MTSIERDRETPRVLIVDASPTSLSFARKVLSEDGYQVDTGDNIFVSTKVMDFRPHLVLMDVQLGASMGTIAVTALKRCGFASQTIFALFSNVEEKELEQLASDCGADAWIRKTECASSLSDKVRKILAGHPAGLVEDA